jgi:hypothetical protein
MPEGILVEGRRLTQLSNGATDDDVRGSQIVIQRGRQHSVVRQRLPRRQREGAVDTVSQGHVPPFAFT